MSNDKSNEFAGEILTPEIARKQIIEIGKVARALPTAGIFDEPTRCFKANLEWTPHIMGMVHWLADVTAWQDADDENYIAIREILRFMQGEECMALQLRQKPDNDCVLQQSLDAGETWSDVFDFSLCVTIQDKSYQVTVQNQVVHNEEAFQTIYNNYTTNYAGLPADVHSNLAPPTGDKSAYRAALCNALISLVNTACDTAISYYTQQYNALQGEANFLLAIAAFTFTAIALAAAIPSAGTSLVALAAIAPEIALGIGLGAGLANYLVDFWQQHTIDQFQDASAKESVACYLLDCLTGTDISLADFRTCLDGTIADTNSQTILDFIEILFEHDSTYAAFLEKWSNNKEFADAGISLFCPCISDDFRIFIWDFTNGLGDFSIQNGTLENGRIRGASIGGNTRRALITMPYTSTWRIKSLNVLNERVNGTGAGGGNSRRASLREVGTYVGEGDIIYATNALGNGVRNDCFHYSGANYADGKPELALRFDVDGVGGEIYIDKVTIAFYKDFAKGGYTSDDGDVCS